MFTTKWPTLIILFKRWNITPGLRTAALERVTSSSSSPSPIWMGLVFFVRFFQSPLFRFHFLTEKCVPLWNNVLPTVSVAKHPFFYHGLIFLALTMVQKKNCFFFHYKFDYSCTTRSCACKVLPNFCSNDQRSLLNQN